MFLKNDFYRGALKVVLRQIPSYNLKVKVKIGKNHLRLWTDEDSSLLKIVRGRKKVKVYCYRKIRIGLWYTGNRKIEGVVLNA